MPEKNLIIDFDALHADLDSMSPDQRGAMNQLLFEVLTTDRLQEIVDAVLKCRTNRSDDSFSMREAVPDIAEEEEKWFDYCAQFFITPQ
jgi:hypothetical protein